MTPPDPTLLVHPPRQERSRRTLENIVQAGRTLVRTQGPDALTVSELARRARTSVGAFYARFPGKEEMVRYLGERFLATARAPWEGPEGEDEGAAPEPPATLQEALQRLASDLSGGEAALLMALHGTDDPPPTRLSRFDDAVARTLVPLLAPLQAPGGTDADHAEQARLQALALVAGTRALVEREGTADPSAIARALAALVGGAPSAPSTDEPSSKRDPAPDPDPPSVDVFDVWG